MASTTEHLDPAKWAIHDEEGFGRILGSQPRLELLLSHDAYPFAHEAGVYIPSKDELYITSNQFSGGGEGKEDDRRVQISKISLSEWRKGGDAGAQVVVVGREEVPSHGVPMGNGGVNFPAAEAAAVGFLGSSGNKDEDDEEDDAILFCAQGDASSPSGLYLMSSHGPEHRTAPLLTSVYGRPFNSVNDVVLEPLPLPPKTSSLTGTEEDDDDDYYDEYNEAPKRKKQKKTKTVTSGSSSSTVSGSSSSRAIWFTDPAYGHAQGYRPRPSLPAHVYRYDPGSGSCRAMADGFGRPNGLCFSPDGQTLYVTDTEAVSGRPGDVDWGRGASIYAFDVTRSGHHGQPFLTNRRLFAYCFTGIPDGIKCDVAGNVYSGCGDGVHVWSAGGVLLGRILVEGGVANFCFGRPGELFLLNENKLWRAVVDGAVRGALLGI